MEHGVVIHSREISLKIEVPDKPLALEQAFAQTFGFEFNRTFFYMGKWFILLTVPDGKEQECCNFIKNFFDIQQPEPQPQLAELRIPP